MKPAEVATVFAGSFGRWNTPQRTQILARLSSIYEDNGVLVDGFAPSLERCCPSAPVCWKRAEHRRQPGIPAKHGPGENGSIFWPWVGERYKAGGVCVIALNIHHNTDWWSMAVEYAIEDKVVNGLAAGKRQVFRSSRFAYRGLATALAVLRSLDGADAAEQPPARDLAQVPERIARLQAVKCSPRGNRSYPTSEMRDECPSRFAQRELGVLKPGVIVALGRDAHDAVRLLGQPSWTVQQQGFARGRITVAEVDIEVLSVPHPSSWGRRWPEAQAALVESLRAAPLQPRR